MGEQVRITRNAFTRFFCRGANIFRRMARKKPIEYITRSEVETATKRKDYGGLKRILEFCENKERLSIIYERIDEFAPRVLVESIKRKGNPFLEDKLFLRLFVVYSKEEKHKIRAIELLISGNHWNSIATAFLELKDKKGEREEKIKRAILHILEKNIETIISKGKYYALIIIKANTKNKKIIEQINQALRTSKEARVAFDNFKTAKDYKSIALFLQRGVFREIEEGVVAFLESKLDEIIDRMEIDTLLVLRTHTHNKEIIKRLDTALENTDRD